MGAPMVGAHRHLPGHGSALGPLALLECGGQLRAVCALLGGCVCLWPAHTGTRLVTGSALGPLALLECGGRLRTERALHGVWVPMVGAHRHSPGHGSALGLLALLECGGPLRTACALLGGCVCLWSAHIGTRLVTRSALEPLALLECGDQLRTASALHGVYGSVCVPMVGAHRYSPGHSSALGPLALLECGGQLRTASALLRGCVCLWSAHTGTRLVTVVPLDRWHGWNAAVRFAQRVRCLVGVCAYGRRTPALAWSRAMPLGRWHCWNAAVGFAQYVRCLVPCVPMVGAHRCSPVRTVDSVIVLRKGAGVGANAASIVYARIAGLGGCAAGPAACVLLSSETGSSGLRAVHGGSRRCGGGIS
jgi:hypothetical protein